MKQITSLRGLAIILIILFHLNPEHFPYGYFGVEVFLVISGYLLMKSLQKQQMQIRLGEFARKKVLRLFTPVAVIVPLTLLAGMFLLDYTDLATASSTGGYTLIGAANRFLAVIQSDYFAQDSSGNPFLHMWYLAVTAQIYLLFAGGCVLYRYLPKRAVASLFWIAGIGSFLWAYSYPIHNLLQEIGLPVWEQVRPTSHYMTLPRLWEVCAGILLAIYPPPFKFNTLRKQQKNALLFLLGMLCILVPALSRGKDVSLCSAAVVLGTCLVIRYAESGRLAHWFNNKLLLWIGGISFSLYLVHMPLIAFYHSWFLHAPGWPGMLAIGAASAVLGGLLYLTVEKKRMKMKWFIPLYLFALLLCVAGRQTEGFRNYINQEINSISSPQLHGASEIKSPEAARGFDKEAIKFNNNIFAFVSRADFKGSAEPGLLQLGSPAEAPSIVLLGDSHASAAFCGLDVACRELDISGIYVSSVISPFWNWELPALPFDASYYCDEKKIKALMAWLNVHPEISHVVIAQHWSTRYDSKNVMDWKLKPLPSGEPAYSNSLRAFISELRAMGKQVILLAPTPLIKQNDVAKYIRNLIRRGETGKGLESLTCTRQKYREDHAAVLPILDRLEQEGICTVLRILPYIPEDRPFNAYEHGEILYKDSDHMSSKGSIKLFQHLKPQLKEALKKESTASSGLQKP